MKWAQEKERDTFAREHLDLYQYGIRKVSLYSLPPLLGNYSCPSSSQEAFAYSIEGCPTLFLTVEEALHQLGLRMRVVQGKFFVEVAKPENSQREAVIF